MLEQLKATSHLLSPDTQVVLLLCGRFGQSNASHATQAKSLTQSEYDRLALWLVQHDMRPADLLESSNVGLLEDAGAALPVSFPRISLLLDRSGALALALESWTNKGLWVISRSDPSYPARLKVRRLNPPLLYGAGNVEMLSAGGLAIVGSREIDREALDYTQRVARACARQRIQVVSGGARGVDTEAMLAALEEGGTSVGVLADSLLRAALSGKYRNALVEGRLALISPFDPAAGFDVGTAMARNKYVYGLADYALIVHSSLEKGGTWAGAAEALKAGTTPVFVRAEGNVPPGNNELLRLGAQPFPERPWADLRDRLQSVSRETAAAAQALAQRNGSPANGLLPDLEERPSQPLAPAPYSQPASQTQSGETYEEALPRLLSLLEELCEDKTLAKALGVKLSQVRIWLKQAMAEGKVEKSTHPVRYRLAPPRLPLD